MIDKEYRKPTAHNMKRRSHLHDYSHSGLYHITISATKELHQPLGQMAGRLDKPDGDSEAPHVVLSPLGRMVEQELTESIQRYYPMLKVLDYVIMPEHIHFLLVAYRDVLSRNGRPTHLGQVIAGFKYGCNKRYWAMTGKALPAISDTPAAEPPGTQGSVLSGLAAKPEPAKPDAPPLFDGGYCDVMPIDEAQLETQRAYIRNNPRNRLLRMSNRQWLLPQRMCVDTHLSLRALKGYLQRECLPSQMTEEVWQRLSERLLVKDGMIYCDRYGSDELLTKRLLPVVCHREDAPLYDTQLLRCMDAADEGAVMVSARIAKREQMIMDAMQKRSYPVVLITDNGFPEIFHPSEEKQTLCAASRLLLLTPWKYHYRKADEGITVVECKTMNCITQAVCRLRDEWWKQNIAS